MPYRDILTPLMQRLVGLVGAPTALQLASTIPKLAVDPDGTVVDYDRDDPRATARQLIEHYEVAIAIAGSPIHQAPPSAGEGMDQVTAQDDGLSAPPIRILVVDDHALVREGLVSLIEPQPDLRVVGQAGTLHEAVDLAQRLRPDVVLMDFTLPDGTGDQATRAILARLPATKIVFLTVHDDDARLFAAVAAGAQGYLLKSVRSADLLSRLRGAVRGEAAFSPAITRRVLAEAVRRSPQPAVAAPQPAADALTPREVDVLRLIVQGHTNRQIADALRISVRTVEHRRANIASRLGLRSRADLVRYAAAHGLLKA